MAASDTGTSAARWEFVVTRVIAAPRELAFKAWTERDRLARWWGPKGAVMQVRDLDLRPGGACHYSMRAPDGHNMWGKWVSAKS
ncbi:MAG TPA: SRPBCC domain-containing protein [Chloroflexota bacterium]|jgi:uncharacterized protein YndB with AHSA1/START domain